MAWVSERDRVYHRLRSLYRKDLGLTVAVEMFAPSFQLAVLFEMATLFEMAMSEIHSEVCTAASLPAQL